MSYSAPPGLKPFSNSASPHPSLPARPPPSTSSTFKPAFSAAPTSSSSAYAQRQVNGGQSQAWQTHSPVSAVGPTLPPNYASAPYNYQQQSYGHQQQQQQQQPPQTQYPAVPTPPQIQNPFPLPGPNNGTSTEFDPDEAAQIAQWQSAYAGQDTSKSGPNANHTPLGNRSGEASGTTKQDTADHTSVAPGGKQKTVMRTGGGTSWQDETLLEWDPAHHRLMVGNLAGEVTDESLLKAFSKYTSVQKARVIRDKRTQKSKGFGFVSFSDGDDYFNAYRQMANKYIGSHPVTIEPCKTKIVAVDVPESKHFKKGKGGKWRGKETGGHANTGSGVQKKQPKTKGGLKILG